MSISILAEAKALADEIIQFHQGMMEKRVTNKLEVDELKGKLEFATYAKYRNSENEKILREAIFKTENELLSENFEAKTIELDLKVEALAQKINQVQGPERSKAESALLSARTHLISHVPVNGLTTTLYLNLIQPLTVAQPSCPAYRKIAIPTISQYQVIGSNNSCIRLPPSSVRCIPPNILKVLGDISNKETDLFSIAIDASNVRYDRDYVNLNVHAWSHRFEQPGVNKNFDVEMGIFPEVGVERMNIPGSIAFDSLSPMNVHVHNSLYSPDNAHFKNNPPFSIFWAVARHGNRIAITKMFLYYKDTPFYDLFHRTTQCKTLAEHVALLPEFKTVIEQTLNPVIELFDKNAPEAMAAFHQLPKGFQNGIFKETWLSFDSPQGINGDFGKASFYASGDLEKKYHCDNAKRSQAIAQFSRFLQNLLIDSQIDLLQNTQPLVQSDDVVKMMRCAQTFFERREKEAMQELGKLSEKQQKDVFQAAWELNGCRGEISQMGMQHQYIEERAQAVLLAASRQHQPLAPLHVPSHNADPAPASPPSSSDVLYLLTELAFDAHFARLNNQERAAKVNTYLKQMSLEKRNAVYGRVYENSRDPNKGGPNWGERHVADDLDVLLNAASET